MMKTIFHIDVNNAFLSWEATEMIKEAKNNNENIQDIRNIPSAICGDANSRKGIILAKSTSAKKYGITTGEPTFTALKKCPNLLCISPRYELYKKYSNDFFNILGRFSDRVEKFSIDEGFLDYTGMEKIWGPPLDGAKALKDTIKNELGITVNIGISTNKILAKMAGDLEKPDKIITLYPEEVQKKLWPLPIDNMFMVGRRTAPKLKNMGIYTIGQLANYNIDYLFKEFKNYAFILKSYANGTAIETIQNISHCDEVKTIGNSITLPSDISSLEEALIVLLSLSETVSSRLRSHNLLCREVAVTIKTSDFRVYTHQKKLTSYIDCTNAIFDISKEIFKECWKNEPIRLLGIRTGDFSEDDFNQISINENIWEKERQAEIAIDKIRSRFGENSIKRSSLLKSNIEKRN